MSPGVRKLALTAHVTSSVGWFGAVAAFLALAIAGLTGGDDQMARATCIGMDLTASFVIVPLCLASLGTGIVQSLGTPWGLFRHYWVLFKLGMTVVATIVLFVHMRPIRFLARAAADVTFTGGDHAAIRTQLVADAAIALAVLLVAITLAVYKPRGVTPYARRSEARVS